MDVGIVLDVETTGLNPDKDSIIEIGLLEFSLVADKAPMITGTYGGVEDPGKPLSEEIIQLTGIDPEFLSGRTIDWDLVRTWLGRASVVIAHNASFDRSFIERRSELDGLPIHWACSARHVAWGEKGYRSRALNYLAADHGFVNPFAHRAVFDCATTFRLVAPHIDELVARSYEREFLFKAVGSPFETKDVLRLRGYKWDRDERVWSKVINEGGIEDERSFLSAEVYGGRSELPHLEIPL